MAVRRGGEKTSLAGKGTIFESIASTFKDQIQNQRCQRRSADMEARSSEAVLSAVRTDGPDVILLYPGRVAHPGRNVERIL